MVQRIDVCVRKRARVRAVSNKEHMSVRQGGAAFIVSRPMSPSSGEPNNNICWVFCVPFRSEI